MDEKLTELYERQARAQLVLDGLGMQNANVEAERRIQLDIAVERARLELETARNAYQAALRVAASLPDPPT